MEMLVSHPKRGWMIVLAILFIQTISSGLGFYNMSVYMSFFVKEFGFSVDLVSISVSLFLCLVALLVCLLPKSCDAGM